MNQAVLYDLLEQFERIAGALETLAKVMEPEDEPKEKTAEEIESQPHLSLFLEELPTWQYNCLRRKILPTKLTAQLLGISPAQLNQLNRKDVIKGKSGRYDLLRILEYMDGNQNYDRLIQHRRLEKQKAEKAAVNQCGNH